MIVPLLVLLLAFSVAPAGSETQGGELSPWTIEGESLEGSRSGVTRLRHPRAEREGTVVTAREGLLRHADDHLVLIGEVEIVEEGRTITADSASFDRLRGLGILRGRVFGVGPEGEISAREVWYWRDARRIELRDSARVADEGREVLARRIDYDLVSEAGVATGSVRILVPEQRVTIVGERCRFDRASDAAEVTGGPRLRREGVEGELPVDLFADTIEVWHAEQRGVARGNVLLRRGSVEATAGRARFSLADDILRLEEGPVAHDPDGSVTGDSMAVVLQTGRAERLEVLGHAILRYRPLAKPGEWDFLTGDTLIADIDSSGVHGVVVRGRARSLYIPSPEDRAKEAGSNFARSRRLHVTFADGEAARVDLEGAVTGEYLLPREKPDTTVARLSDSLYVARALAHFLSMPDQALPDSLERAGPFALEERISYEGESISYYVPKRRIEIRKSGKIRYQNLELASEEIVYEAARERVTAMGEPTLRDPSSQLVGERMVYRLDRRDGFVYQGRTQFEGGTYQGEEIKRVDKKILLVKDGDYTTCDADTFHYHFHSDRMKIRLGDRVVARPIVLYLKNIPLMAVPYWIFPLRTGRQSGVLMPDVEFGFDRRRGRFLRNIGYYYAPNDFADAMVWGDYYENDPRWILNGQFRYNVRYLLSGDLFTSYSGQETSGVRRKRWDLRGGHEQTLGERFSLKIRGDFVSDRDYRDDRDFGGTVDERLNRILKSNVDLRKSWSRASLSVTASRTEYLDEGSSAFRLQQNLPSVDFGMNSFPLGRPPDASGRGGRLAFLSTVYGRFSSSFRSTFDKPWSMPTRDNQAVRATTGLTDNRSIGSYLKISPSISTSGAWFRRDARGEAHQSAAVWDAGLSARSTLYGTFPVGLGPLIGLRHVVEPSASYRYAPDFPSLRAYDPILGREVPRFPSVGGIGLGGGETRSISFGLTQRFHLKLRGEDAKKPRKIENLILWSTSTSYNFLADEDRRFSSVNNSLRLSPSRMVENSWSVTHDPYRKVMVNLSARTSLRLSGSGGGSRADTTAARNPLEDYGGFGQAESRTLRPGERRSIGGTPWSVSIAHTYSRGERRSSESNTMNLSTSLHPTRGWRLNYSIYFDMRKMEIRSHSFTLDRDMHCWEMRLDRRVSGPNAQYYFRIHIKSLPDVRYERQRR